MNEFGTEGQWAHCLVTTEERDVDLLLMEEFHISQPFVNWFCDAVGVPHGQFTGAWHSVCDGDGETDLLLRVDLQDGSRIAILIENKIAAVEQARQDERYHIRGARGQDEGKYDRYVTCMCAPRAYLQGMRSDSLYQHKLEYEKIRDWYLEQADLRSKWRAAVLTQAIEQGRRGYIKVVNQTKTAFHLDLWGYLAENYPKIAMNYPTPKGSNSDWVILGRTSLPAGVTLNYKFARGHVDLTFDGWTVERILGAGVTLSDRCVTVGHGKSASVRMLVPVLISDNPILDQYARIDAAAAAALTLLELAEPIRSKAGSLDNDMGQVVR